MRLPVFVLALAACFTASVAASAETALEQRGCIACHSLDGAPSRGPTFRGLAGAPRSVLRNGAPATLTADRDYLARSILTPDAEVVEGYPAGSMPAFKLTQGEARALAEEIESLPPGGAPAEPRSITLLLVSTLAFVGLHLLLSSLPVRRRLSERVGAGGFQGVYSLVALASFAGIIVGFRSAPYIPLWAAPPVLRWLPNILVPIAWILLVCSMTTKSPTMAGKPGEPPRSEVIGIVRVTRHPMLWAFALWGLAHLPPNGNARGLLLFGGFAVLSLAGMWHSDARRAALFPDVWAPVAKSTSVLPFAAILGGRNRFVFKEIGPWRLVAGLVLWAAALHFHKMLYGLSPLP